MTPRVRLHLLQAGSCLHPEAMARAGASLCPARFPALVGLMLHPDQGAVLFDTGYDPAFGAATRRWPERLYRLATPVTLAAGESVAEQLPAFGLAPADIRAVVISHFHGDHVAGLHAFPGAQIFCARAGLGHLRCCGRFGAVRQGMLPGLIPADLDRRARFFEELPRRALPSTYAPFEGGADLFGDGSLLAVELPGHCPGHWGLALRSEDDRLNFMIGDAAWSRRAVRDNAPPPRLTTALLGETVTYRETLRRLHQLHGRNADLRIIPSHCPEAAEESDRVG